MIQTDFANTLQSATEYMTAEQKYDASCKRVLEYKLVLARILKATVRDFSNLEYDEIERLIYEVSGNEYIDSDMPLIQNVDTETVSNSDGIRRFDVKFYVNSPSGDVRHKLIINVEAQKSFQSFEEIHKRAEYYVSRLISSQYNKVFKKSDFKGINKVHSIWICLQPNADYRNSIIEFPRKHNVLAGTPRVKESNYDISSYVIVGLNENINSEIEIIRFLDVLFSATTDSDIKKRILSDDFGIPMEEDGLGKELDSMCDFSKAVLERGIEQGIEKGIEKGKEESKREVAEKMLTNKLPLSLIESISELTENAILAIADNLGIDVVR